MYSNKNKRNSPQINAKLQMSETTVQNVSRLKRNIFDIRTISHLKRVAYYTEMVPGKKYAAVPGFKDGTPKHAWLTEFEFIGLFDEHSILGNCIIMDGNYTFPRIFTDSDSVIYELSD